MRSCDDPDSAMKRDRDLEAAETDERLHHSVASRTTRAKPDRFAVETRLDGLPMHKDPKTDPAETDLAWAAGLFEGEGSITCSGRAPRLQLKMTDPEPVERFCEILGGTLYGPYENHSGEKDGYPRSPFYLWVSTRDEARAAFEKMRPWMSNYRLCRFAEVFGGAAA